MKFSILLDGSKKTVTFIPENDSDRKLMEFMNEHKTALITVERGKRGNYDYTEPAITGLKFTLDNSKTNTDS